MAERRALKQGVGNGRAKAQRLGESPVVSRRDGKKRTL
jgi:hypothetical protein